MDGLSFWSFDNHKALPACPSDIFLSDIPTCNFCCQQVCHLCLPAAVFHLPVSHGIYTNICEDTVIVNGQNNALFIKKKFLLEFIEENELDVVWTVLGEKQKITGGFGEDFSGRAEFSYTYYMDEKYEVMKNHEVYNVVAAITL